MELVSLEQVRQAAGTIEGVALVTPFEPSRVLSEYAGGPVYLKCENLQRTGAFKIRGAYNRIARLPEQERARGVVCASAGNHAQGVALAATLLDVKATVFMPEGAALPKIEATERYGAEVRLGGAVYDEAFESAEKFAADTGAVMVHPFDHPDVIAGQGTVALEIVDRLPEVKTIVVPVGGGGLISGIAAAAKGLLPGVRIVGVEPKGAAEVSAALSAGHPVSLPTLSTIADGLAAKQTGEITFAHLRELVDDVVQVSDDEISQALLLMLERAKLVVEPSGAAAVAAIMQGLEVEPPVAVVLSGGNIDPLLLLKVIRFGMGSVGRYFWFRTRVPDHPGELHRLLGVIADAGANIIGIEHHREGVRLRHLGEVEVAVQVETRGGDHVSDLKESLSRAGYEIEKP
ncbi:MAG: threonine ammonia-lyase [Actinobacteria bacterium]|nr:threonine ammonia-lyase [Actinomycetota bacterium]